MYHYHFTLAHKHPSMAIRNKICTLPRVRNRSSRKTESSAANEASRIQRKVGLSDEPGVKMLEKKPPSGFSSGSVLVGGRSVDSSVIFFEVDQEE